MAREIWKAVVGWEGLYEVSDQGRVRALPTKFRHGVRILKPSLRIGGYYRIALSRSGARAQPLVHRLVLETFVGPCPPDHESRHKDGTRGNNRLGNLAWGTKLENAADRKIHGTQCQGESHGRAKVTESDVIAIRAAYAAGGVCQGDLGRRYGLGQTKISAIVRREHWRHIP